MNLPNKLTLIRIISIPFFILFAVYDFFPFDDCYGDWLSRSIAALLFIGAAITDFLDGHIARKHNLITDFGKFMDPLADKFLILGSLMALCVSAFAFEYNAVCAHDFGVPAEVLRQVFFWAAVVVLFRELAVTSLRLVVASSAGKVVAASWWGKVKTTTQCVAIILILLEPALLCVLPDGFTPLCSYVAMAAMLIATIGSGLDYMKTYMPYIDTNK